MAASTARTVTRVIPEVVVEKGEAPPTVLETESKPSPTEEFLMPPGMVMEDVKPKVETTEEKPGEKIKWDYSELLASGTLGNLMKNIHEAAASGTGWDGWKLNENETAQYDKTLGMILKPLMQKVEYLPLVIGILSLAMLEAQHFAGFMKYRKEEREKEEAEAPVQNIPATATTVSPVITAIPTRVNAQGQQISLGGEPMPPSPYDVGPARTADGHLLDNDVPPLRRSDVVPGGVPLPPIHPSQMPNRPPRLNP